MIETIGKVRLDLDKYPGEDYYSDGEVEDELLEIVMESPQENYAQIIRERKEWPVLYHLSPFRENIVDWLPMTGSEKVLEVGSGCGAVTGALARMAGSVTCVELSKKRSLINAYRHRECENVTIHVGNFKDIEPELPRDYDYICLIGVFEYGQGYIGGETPYEDFLRTLLPHLAHGGRIIIAIENRYGLKYFAGCREDHLGTYFGGIEGYTREMGVRTFGRNELMRIFEECGVREQHFYYPYPDYKFMTTLYSDDRLPQKGELYNNLRNFDQDRMLLFDEKKAFDGILEEGLFPCFSNSYLVVLGEAFPVEYVRYSNDRAPEYAIRTQIQKSAGGRVVCKYPLSAQACEHVKGMALSCEKLKERFLGSGLKINECALTEAFARPEPDASSAKAGRPQTAACFEYVEGISLSALLDTCLERGDVDGFYEYFREFVRRISYNSEFPAADFDLAFSNLLVSGGEWTLIDYEWTFGQAIPPKELAYRAVYCYLLENDRRKILDEERLLRELELTKEEAALYRDREAQFQQFVTGGRRAMTQLREDLGRRVIVPQRWIDRYQDSAQVSRFQVYEDRGGGFREEDSYFVPDAYQGEELIETELRVEGDVLRLRVDPAMDACLVKLVEAAWNGEALNLRDRHILTANGKLFPGSGAGEEALPSVVFPTADPNLLFCLEKLKRQEENRLSLRMEIRRLPLSMARDLAAKRGLKSVIGR